MKSVKLMMMTLMMSLALVSCDKDDVEPNVNQSSSSVDTLSVSCVIKKDSMIHHMVIDNLTFIPFETMTIEDNLGNITNWEFISGQDSILIVVDSDTSMFTKINTYSTTNFIGVEDRSYTLKFIYNNKTYQNTKQMINGQAVLDFDF